MKRLIGAVFLTACSLSHGNDLAVKTIEHFEKCKTTPYSDQGGKWTIGYGEKLKGRTRVSCFSSHQTVVSTVNQIKKKLKDENIHLTYNREAAVISLIYNVGWESFINSSFKKNLKRRNYWMSWIYVGKKRSRGLAIRRNHEYDLFNFR